MSRVRLVAIIGLLAGLAAATLLILHRGVGAVWDAASALGWGGFAAVLAVHGVLVVVMGLSWWVLGLGRADARPARFVWGRLIRDAASEALPLSQVGGYVFGARAAALAGVSGAFAAASTAVDITAELAGQLLYTLLGLGLLAALRPGDPLLWPLFVGVLIMAVLGAGFVVVQARGAGAIERLGARMVRDWLHVGSGKSDALARAMGDIYGRHGALLLAVVLHTATWVGSGLETWLTLRLMGEPTTIGQALVIDSLLYGIRSVAFLVPNALGVQEGALVMLGGMFGLGPAHALALSLIKRARDLAIGVPALLAWQLLEGRRVWPGKTPAERTPAERTPAGADAA